MLFPTFRFLAYELWREILTDAVVAYRLARLHGRPRSTALRQALRAALS